MAPNPARCANSSVMNDILGIDLLGTRSLVITDVHRTRPPGAAGWAFVVLLRQLYYICQPSEVLIAGLRRTTGSGQGGVSHREGGAASCAEEDKADQQHDHRPEGGQRLPGEDSLNVSGVANIKISDEPEIHNAIERLIGKSQDEIHTSPRRRWRGICAV